MPKQPFISIPLDIPDVRVLQTDLTKAGEFILTVESTLMSTSCRRCGRTIAEQHGTDQPRLLRHLPILGRPVYLRIRPKRFRCPFCDDHPTTTQTLDWHDPAALHTKAYERHLIVQLINSTLTDVTEKEDVSYDVSSTCCYKTRLDVRTSSLAFYGRSSHHSLEGHVRELLPHPCSCAELSPTSAAPPVVLVSSGCCPTDHTWRSRTRRSG
jgi:transposase